MKHFTLVNGFWIFLAPIKTSDYYAPTPKPKPVLQSVAPFHAPNLYGGQIRLVVRNQLVRPAA